MARRVASRTRGIRKKLRRNSYAPPWRHLVAVLFVVTLVTASPASAGLTLHQTFDDPAVTVHDRFGFSVAIDGNNVLIGASLDDTNGPDVGQAH